MPSSSQAPRKDFASRTVSEHAKDLSGLVQQAFAYQVSHRRTFPLEMFSCRNDSFCLSFCWRTLLTSCSILLDAADRDEGCTCHTCITPDIDVCLNTNQPCKCKNGNCLPNYLPENTACDAADAGVTLEVCQVGQCSNNGECTAKVGPLLSACYALNDPSCENAGQCAIREGALVCDLLNCVIPPADILCENKLEGDACTDDSGTCCPEVDGGTLQCNTDEVSGFCPCVTSAATTCNFNNEDKVGYCCLLTGGVFECVENAGSCSGASFCQIVTGLDNVGCSPSSSCGTGNADCNNICSQLETPPDCVSVPESCSCSATGVPGISSVDCV